MNKKLRLLNLLAVIALLISACNLPSSDSAQNIASTVAAQTVQALLSATPVMPVTVPPSVTPIPILPTLTPIPLPVNTNTPAATATSNCYVAQFISDITIPDGTIIAPGGAFTKTWRIKNIGSCAWNGFSLIFDSGESMGGPATSAVATLNPGLEIDLSVNLTAPTTPGTYRGYWRIVTNSNVSVPIIGGAQFNKSFYVEIKSQTATTTTPGITSTPTVTTTPATATATGTLSPDEFAVTDVKFIIAGGCGNFSVFANISANGAGVVVYHFVRSDDLPDNASHAPLVFTEADTQPSEIFTWNTTTKGDYWVKIYIDSPNQKMFGRANFSCP
jgi:hypothetical protein